MSILFLIRSVALATGLEPWPQIAFALLPSAVAQTQRLRDLRPEPGCGGVAAVPSRTDEHFVETDARRQLGNVDDEIGHLLGLNHARAVRCRDRHRAPVEDRG